MVGNRCVLMAALVLLLSAGSLGAEGLAASYGGSLPSVYDEGDQLPELKGKHLKVLKMGVLNPDESATIKDVVYEKNAACLAVGYARGQDADLDVFVTEANGGQEIGRHTGLDNHPLVSWRSGENNNTVDIRVQNRGRKSCTYVLLANY